MYLFRVADNYYYDVLRNDVPEFLSCDDKYERYHLAARNAVNYSKIVVVVVGDIIIFHSISN